MKKKYLLNSAGLIVISALLSATAFASDDVTPMNQHVGPYIEGGLGTNLIYTAIGVTDNSFSFGGINGFGWSGDVGYNFTPGFALEGGFMQNYGHYDIKDDNDVSQEQWANTNVPYVTARWNFFVGPRGSIFLKTGILEASAVYKEDNASQVSNIGVVLPFVGIGGSYALTPKWDVNVQYQGAVYGIAGAGLLSAGLGYHFS